MLSLMLPLAPDLPVAKRQSTLTALLARVQQNDRRTGPRQPIPQTATPPAEPAQEKISAFDDRWSTPQKPAAQPLVAQTPPAEPAQEKISAFDDRWSTPQKPVAQPLVAQTPPAEPAQEKISAFDDRWSTPQKPAVQASVPVTAKPAVAAKPAAPPAAPSGDRTTMLQTLLERIQHAGRRAR